jgi:beta-N-acetylhexosaminidase
MQLYAHPFSSYCQKVLIALYENATPFELRLLDFGDPRIVAELAGALCAGLRDRGMASVGKHFPGHGWVGADSHHALPVDPRPFAEIEREDLVPFALLARASHAGSNAITGAASFTVARRGDSTALLDAVMPAHVLYPGVDGRPAGFSPVWLQQVLRATLGFDGMIFSDDLEMAGAHAAGDIVERAQSAVSAGCDVVLACNDFAQMDFLLDRWRPAPAALADALRRRWARMERLPAVDARA